VFCRIRNRYATIEQALYEDPLGPLDGHPLHAHILQRSAQLGDASLLVGEAAFKEDLAPRLLYDAEGVLFLGPIDPGAGGYLLIHPQTSSSSSSLGCRLPEAAVGGCGLDEDEVPLRMLIGRRSKRSSLAQRPVAASGASPMPGGAAL
jgi:hypothetical protein